MDLLQHTGMVSNQLNSLVQYDSSLKANTIPNPIFQILISAAGVPLLFEDPEFRSGYSTKSEVFGRCDNIPDMPSTAPSLSLQPSEVPSSLPSEVPSGIGSSEPSTFPSSSPAPSLRPSEDPCPDGVNQDPFKMVLTPDSNNPEDISVAVYGRSSGDPFNLREIFAITYVSSEANQEAHNCVWNRLCLHVVITSASGMGIGDGSFTARWRGK